MLTSFHAYKQISMPNCSCQAIHAQISISRLIPEIRLPAAASRTSAASGEETECWEFGASKNLYSGLFAPNHHSGWVPVLWARVIQLATILLQREMAAHRLRSLPRSDLSLAFPCHVPYFPICPFTWEKTRQRRRCRCTAGSKQIIWDNRYG